MALAQPIKKTCTCGNLTASGQHFSRVYKTGLNEMYQQAISKKPELLLQIRASGINIKDSDKVVINKRSEIQCDLVCTQCGGRLHVYFSRGNAFCQFSSRVKRTTKEGSESPPAASSGTSLLSSVPRHMRSLISIEDDTPMQYEQSFESTSQDMFSFDAPSTDKDENEDEDDFNLMFSNTNEPIVGSYTESPMSFGFF